MDITRAPDHRLTITWHQQRNVAPTATPPNIAKQDPINTFDGYSNLVDPDVPVAFAPSVPVENCVSTVPIFV